MKTLKQKLFPHQTKLQTKWWHRLAKVLFVLTIIIPILWLSEEVGYLNIIQGLIIWTVIAYLFYYWGVLYIAYGRDK